MTGTIQGRAVTWETRNPGHGKHLAIMEGVYQANPTIQDTGPKARLITLRAWIDPPDMDLKVRTIQDLVSYTGLCIVTDAANIFYDDDHAFVRIGDAPVTRAQRRSNLDFQAAYVGNNKSHRVGLLATVKHLPNEWALPGKVALRVPVGCSLEAEALTDAARRVIQSPAAFSDFEAEYVADGVDRNGGALVRCHATDPGTLFQDVVQAIVASVSRYGFGYDLTQATIRNPAVDVLLNAALDKLTFTDRIGSVAAYSLDVAPFVRATHGGAQMPATPQRHTVILDTDLKLTALDNGVVHVRPGGGLLKAPGGATRALGTGVYWYSPAANTYLVATVDFTVAADGTVGYGGITYGAEKLVNPAFETYTTTPGAPDSWTSMAGAGVAFTQDLEVIHEAGGGLSSVKVTAGGASDQGLKQTLVGLTDAVQAFVEVYARTGGGASEQARLVIRNTTDAVDVAVINGTVAGTGWERLFASFTPAAGKTYEAQLLHAAGAATRVIYFDDGSVKQFSSQASDGAEDAVFAVVFTTDVGAARDARLREAFVDYFAEWVPEAR